MRRCVEERIRPSITESGFARLYDLTERVVPADVRAGVLAQLAASDIEFEAVPDLCEMSARQDPRLRTRLPAGRRPNGWN